MSKDSVRNAQKTQSLGLNIQSVNIVHEIVALCSEIHKRHINVVCGLNEEFLNVKLGDI